MLMYVFTNIFSKIKIVRNSFDEFNFLFNFLTFSTQHSYFIFLLLFLAIMRIDIKHITLLYLFNYYIYCFHEILYTLINLTKARTKRTCQK